MAGKLGGKGFCGWLAYLNWAPYDKGSYYYNKNNFFFHQRRLIDKAFCDGAIDEEKWRLDLATLRKYLLG